MLVLIRASQLISQRWCVRVSFVRFCFFLFADAVLFFSGVTFVVVSFFVFCLFAEAVLFFSGVTFVVVSFFVFVLLISLKPRPFVQSLFDMHAPPAVTGSNLTTVFVCFRFFWGLFSMEMSPFPSVLYHSLPFPLCMESRGLVII